jgi:glucose/arabinose dehydrogenase
MRLVLAGFVSALALAGCSASSAPPPASAEVARDFEVTLTPVIDAEFAWGMAFLPNGDLLFTEKEGGLKYAVGGEGPATPVAGMPPALTAGQGGYFGLTLDPDFANNRLVYVAYAQGTEEDNGTAVIRARLSDDHAALEDVTEIFRADSRGTAYHFGGRLQFANDGTLFVSLGEGFKYMDQAQNTQITHGKIVRINSDGTIPEDNPFADGVAGKPSVYSYGHRNIQGLYYDKASGTLYETEHGPKGGDEFNIIKPGANYGWPKITYGVNYDGTIITEKTEMDGMEQPITYWVPSIAPAGLTRLQGDVYPGWQGDFFAGGMNGPAGLELVRIRLEDGKVTERENLFKDEYAIRDVAESPDGHLYVATKDLDGIFRVDVVSE